MLKINSQTKALAIDTIFILIGAFSLLYVVADWQESLPLVIFYLTLVINTYFSIKLFANIVGTKLVTQNIADILLFIIYAVMALSLDNRLRFVYLTLLLFIVAAIKYSFLLGIIDHPKLLKRKILVDLSGVLGSALVLAGLWGGYATLSIWIFSGGFVIANLLLFFVWPLYHPDHT